MSIPMYEKNKFPRNIKNKYIIINHSIDFSNYKNSVFNFNEETTSLQFEDLKKFSREELEYKNVPPHFFIELVKNTYITISGCRIFERSPFLEELVNSGKLDLKYKDSILITLNGNYNKDIPEKDIYIELAYRLSDLIFTFDLSFSNIKMLDDIINDETITSDMKNLDLGKLYLFFQNYK